MFAEEISLNVDESRIIFWKILVGDKLWPVKLAPRLLMAALVLSIGSLTPVLSRETSLSTPHETNCCADINTGRCHSCSTNAGETNPGLGSTCCAAQSVCCALYFTKAKAFVTPMQLIGTVGISDERPSARAQRPPVPPPRSAIS
jgi:hypothetical protein